LCGDIDNDGDSGGANNSSDGSGTTILLEVTCFPNEVVVGHILDTKQF